MNLGASIRVWVRGAEWVRVLRVLVACLFVFLPVTASAYVVVKGERTLASALPMSPPPLSR